MVHWYKRDPHAAIEGMLGLTPEERGIYNTLLDMLYARDGNVPNDERLLAMAQQCDVRMWRRVRDSLIAKGKIRVTSGGLLTANRVEVTLNEVRSFSEVQSNRARSRWEKSKKSNDINEPEMPLAVMPAGNASTSTTTTREESPTGFLHLGEVEQRADVRALGGARPSAALPTVEQSEESKRLTAEASEKKYGWQPGLPTGAELLAKYAAMEPNDGKPQKGNGQETGANGGFYAKLDSPEQHAWEDHLGKSIRDFRGGRNYPSQWPPGHANAANH